MRILILGKNGQLGKSLQKAFHHHDIIAYDKKEFNFLEPETFLEKILTAQPDVIINATAFTDVNLAEKNELLANEINGNSVGKLAMICRNFNITLIHFSTDFIFNGENSRGYDEFQQPDPINSYGRSKFLGENLLIEVMEYESSISDSFESNEGNYFIIRTSWLFGPISQDSNKKNFVEKIISKLNHLNLSSNPKIKITETEIGCPTFSEDLAAQTCWLLESKEYPSGIYHITNSSHCNRFTFANQILQTLENIYPEIPKLLNLTSPLTQYLYPERNLINQIPPFRPKSSILLNTKLPPLRSWKEALKCYLEQEGKQLLLKNLNLNL